MQTPWAIILCKFTNDDGTPNDSEPFLQQYYQDLFTANDTGSSWNMARYFSDYSHGKLDLTGTQVFGWYNLDHSVAEYNANHGDARDMLIGWARDAATADGVDLSPFFNTVVCTNLWHDIGDAANGVVAQGPTTQIPSLLGHEMGHGYGLYHSRRDGSQDDYRDPWDIMSAANDYPTTDPEFATIGPGLNASNMRSQGWLDESRVSKANGNGFTGTVKIRPLVRRDLSGHLAAEIGPYLVEYRVQQGWDAGIPRSAVLVHRFDTHWSYIMAGTNGKYDLVAGDKFESGTKGLDSFIQVEVVSIDDANNTATLHLVYQPPPPPPIYYSDTIYILFAGGDAGGFGVSLHDLLNGVWNPKPFPPYPSFEPAAGIVAAEIRWESAIVPTADQMREVQRLAHVHRTARTGLIDHLKSIGEKRERKKTD